MMPMKRLISNLLLLIFTFICVSAVTPRSETLHYKVMYKWGLINKQAGLVTITTTPDGKNIKGRLAAASAPWADKFYKVRDTLNGTMNAKTFMPSFYEKISHEGGEYKRDVINYTTSGNRVTADCRRWRRKKEGKPVDFSTATHTAEGFYLDMMSTFYYMRYLDYADMKKGAKRSMTIFSGKRKELLTLRYDGIEDIKGDDGKTHRCYAITFTFTSTKGGTQKTSDDMQAWISADSARIPILLVGKLPVGAIKCYYTE